MTGQVRVVLLDPPTVPGDACRGCDGSGVTGEHYRWPDPVEGDVPPLLVDVMCPTCQGCGRAEHRDLYCAAREHGEDLLLDDGQDEEVAAAVCPSCHGLTWWRCKGWNVTPDGEPAGGEMVTLRVPCGCTGDRVRLVDVATGQLIDDTAPRPLGGSG